MEFCNNEHCSQGVYSNHTSYIKVFSNIIDTSTIITQPSHDIPEMLVALQLYKKPETNYLAPYNLYSSTKSATKQLYSSYVMFK